MVEKRSEKRNKAVDRSSESDSLFALQIATPAGKSKLTLLTAGAVLVNLTANLTKV